jgi:dihydroorotase
MPLPELIERVTARPAQAVRRSELGTLSVGGIGDATVLAVEEGRFDFIDSIGQKMIGGRQLVCKGCVLAGTFLPVTSRAN